MLKVDDYIMSKGYITDKWINGEIKRIRKGDAGIVMKIVERGLFQQYMFFGVMES